MKWLKYLGISWNAWKFVLIFTQIAYSYGSTDFREFNQNFNLTYMREFDVWNDFFC